MAEVDEMLRAINEHPDIVARCESLAEFAEQAPGCSRFTYYAGGWADKVFRQAKVRPGVITHRPLEMPAALHFADLFKLAMLAEQRPHSQFFYCGGSSAGDAAPAGHFDGKLYLRTLREDGEVVRGIGSSKYRSCYVNPHPEVEDVWNRSIGGDYSPSFEVIKRSDGILVIMRDMRTGIFSVYLALLAHDAELLSMLPDADQALIAKSKAEHAAVEACLEERDGRTYIKEGVTPPCEVRPLGSR